MIRHYNVDDVLRPAFRHMALDAVAAGQMRLYCDFPWVVTSQAYLVISVDCRLTMLYIMRIVARGAAKRAVTFEKALRLAEPVHRIHDLELSFSA
jgi:hypothetical protein